MWPPAYSREPAAAPVGGFFTEWRESGAAAAAARTEPHQQLHHRRPPDAARCGERGRGAISEGLAAAAVATLLLPDQHHCRGTANPQPTPRHVDDVCSGAGAATTDGGGEL